MGLYLQLLPANLTLRTSVHWAPDRFCDSGQQQRSLSGRFATDFTTEVAADLEKAGQPGVRLGRPGPGGRYKWGVQQQRTWWWFITNYDRDIMGYNMIFDDIRVWSFGFTKRQFSWCFPSNSGGTLFSERSSRRMCGFLLRFSVLEGTDRDAQINLGMAGY